MTRNLPGTAGKWDRKGRPQGKREERRFARMGRKDGFVLPPFKCTCHPVLKNIFVDLVYTLYKC